MGAAPGGSSPSSAPLTPHVAPTLPPGPPTLSRLPIPEPARPEGERRRWLLSQSPGCCWWMSGLEQVDGDGEKVTEPLGLGD